MSKFIAILFLAAGFAAIFAGILKLYEFSPILFWAAVFMAIGKICIAAAAAVAEL